MARPEIERMFSVESIWTDRPMGYHLDPAGLHGDIWENRERRKAIYHYCPEIKIILDMHLERERCPDPLPVITLPPFPSSLPMPPPAAPVPQELRGETMSTDKDEDGGQQKESDHEEASIGAAKPAILDHNGRPVPEDYRPTFDTEPAEESVGAEEVKEPIPGDQIDAAPDLVTVKDSNQEPTGGDNGNP